MDDIYGAVRFTFGSRIIETGISFTTVLIGLFAIGEVLDQLSAKKTQEGEVMRTRPKTTLPRFGEIWGLHNTILRGLGIGTVIGAIPGTGATVASFVSYGVEKQVSKTPEKFDEFEFPDPVAPGRIDDL
jgi:putative tricarboxylic transport membrane protein